LDALGPHGDADVLGEVAQDARDELVGRRQVMVHSAQQELAQEAEQRAHVAPE
jgi:hypothetical protein